MPSGVYPSQTETIEVEGVKFSWALMPPKVHRNVQSRLAQFSGMSQEEVLKSGKLDVMLECFEDTVAFSVKGHEGFKDNSGNAIQFKSEQREFRNDRYEAVAQSVIQAYYYSGILELIAKEILEKSNLSGQDEKNSVARSE